ncbi:hypothetical protein J2S55_008131 [Streptosporangium brasiliense]|uniref:Uncharacterized protein n=1 Tax=Streptosporangium brasiliense TaxID=47480 RepID=A0ABT9RKR1_9ACTN|nr:hypothetical protein [Streptosporangium brasiliense]
MTHHGFSEPEGLETCLKSHTLAVDAPFEGGRPSTGERDSGVLRCCSEGACRMM